jgi:hypothetical protein
MTLYLLRPRDRATVKAVIRKLEDPDSADLVLASAVKALTVEPMYLIEAGPKWRIIFRETENHGIEILDVALTERLRIIAEKLAEADESVAKENAEAGHSIATKKTEAAEISRTKELGDLKSPQARKVRKKAPRASKPG